MTDDIKYVQLTYEQISDNMKALTHMFGQKVITKEEYANIALRMGLVVTLQDDKINLNSIEKELNDY